MNQRTFSGTRIQRNNTAIVRTYSGTAVQLHKTTIVFVNHATDTMVLDSGGWRTVTTKRRMNQVLAPSGYGVISRNKEWRVVGNGIDLPFYDGIRLRGSVELAS